MKKVALLNTAIQTPNIGDYIIASSVKREMSQLLKESFVVEIPTHAPFMHDYQILFRRGKKALFQPFGAPIESFDYKFLCGTNILNENMLARSPLWNINIAETGHLNGIVLIGAGCGHEHGENVLNSYTRRFYEKILSHEFCHSVRDERSKRFLENLGFTAINTGCPTLWSLTDERCRAIPTHKSDAVVFTLTDYAKDAIADREMVRQLQSAYHSLAFWVQGIGDYDYLRSIAPGGEIEIINPNIESYDAFLETHDCDYVGTRLHAGIEAMRHGRRAIIVEVDNRLSDMKRSFNLNTLERSRISSLERLLTIELETTIGIDSGAVRAFKRQFGA